MIAALAVLALAAFPSAQAEPQAPPPSPCATITQNVWDPKFTPGQRWTYRSRPVDRETTVIIDKIDDVPGLGLIIQIDVDNVDFYDRGPVGEYRRLETQHLAIKRDSLDASVLQVVGIVSPLPDNLMFYRWWRTDCIARTYSTTLGDTLNGIEASRCAVARQEHREIPACTPGPPTPAPPRRSNPPN